MLRPIQRRPPSPAAATMLRLNPRAFVGWENGRECYIEDVADADDRWYRVEYRVDPSGRRALAYCLHQPWGPSAISPLHSHLMSDGSICTSERAHRGGDDLEYTVGRARFWCTGYSFLREHGLARTREVLGSDW